LLQGGRGLGRPIVVIVGQQQRGVAIVVSAVSVPPVLLDDAFCGLQIVAHLLAHHAQVFPQLGVAAVQLDRHGLVLLQLPRQAGLALLEPPFQVLQRRVCLGQLRVGRFVRLQQLLVPGEELRVRRHRATFFPLSSSLFHFS